MTALRPIGWWIETVADVDLPAPQELVGDLHPTARDSVTKHLRGGLRLVQYRGYSWCRFSCGIPDLSMGSWDLTDGIWVWPEGLSHYIEAHGVVLPREFVEHAISGAVSTEPEKSRPYDDAYWIRWCADRRLPRIESGIREALAKVEAEIPVGMAARIDVLEREQGLSHKKCIWAQCSRKALTDRKVCAEHYSIASHEALVKKSKYMALRNYLREIAAPPDV